MTEALIVIVAWLFTLSLFLALGVAVKCCKSCRCCSYKNKLETSETVETIDGMLNYETNQTRTTDRSSTDLATSKRYQPPTPTDITEFCCLQFDNELMRLNHQEKQGNIRTRTTWSLCTCDVNALNNMKIATNYRYLPSNRSDHGRHYLPGRDNHLPGRDNCLPGRDNYLPDRDKYDLYLCD